MGKGCLTCALHSGQKTVDMEQMLEKLVCTYTWSSIYIYIRAFPQSPHQNFRCEHNYSLRFNSIC